MERGGFHGYRKLSPNTTSGPRFLVDGGMRLPEFNQPNNNAMIVSNAAGNGDNECTVREQDRFMPIANVIRIMRRILPPHAKISDDAKETIQECVSEYISFITGEANERCQREQRKTITAEDVLWAMSKLGFDDYIEPLTLYLHRYRELEGERVSGCSGGSMRGEHMNMISMSSGLLMKRANGMVADYGAYGASLHLAHYHHHHSHRMTHQNGFGFGGYDVNPNLKDAGASSSAAPPAAAAGDGAGVSQYEQHKYRG